MAPVSLEWWLDFVQKGGAISAVLELGALIWMNADRNRLILELKAEAAKVEALAERVLTIAAELKMFLFNERKT